MLAGGGGEREQGVAVIAGERAMILRRAGSPDSTQYCRASLSAASTASDPLGERIDQLEVARRAPRDLGRELLDRIAGERGAVHVGQPLRLPADGLGDLAHAVAHVRDERAAHGVEVGSAPPRRTASSPRPGRCAGSAASASGRRRGSGGGRGLVMGGWAAGPETGPFGRGRNVAGSSRRAPGAGTRPVWPAFCRICRPAPPLRAYTATFSAGGRPCNHLSSSTHCAISSSRSWTGITMGPPRFRWGAVIHRRNERGKLRFGAITPQGESLLLSEPMLDGAGRR